VIGLPIADADADGSVTGLTVGSKACCGGQYPGGYLLVARKMAAACSCESINSLMFGHFCGMNFLSLYEHITRTVQTEPSTDLAACLTRLPREPCPRYHPVCVPAGAVSSLLPPPRTSTAHAMHMPARLLRGPRSFARAAGLAIATMIHALLTCLLTCTPCGTAQVHDALDLSVQMTDCARYAQFASLPCLLRATAEWSHLVRHRGSTEVHIRHV
jgi:hypothetical protein